MQLLPPRAAKEVHLYDVLNVRQAYADYRKALELAPDWDEPAEDLKRYQVVRR